jgi:hypothetical protein
MSSLIVTLTMGAVPIPRAVKPLTRWCPAMMVPVALLTITGLVIPILVIDSLSFSIFSPLIFRGLYSAPRMLFIFPKKKDLWQDCFRHPIALIQIRR